MIAIRAEGLHTYYGKSHILHGVSLEVREGAIVALLGRNGAGKTTTLRSLMGLAPPREGTVRLLNADVTGFPPYRIAAAGVGYVPEGRRVFANLTVEENLKVPVERPGPWTIARIYQLFPRLAERKKNKGRQLSGGEQGISVLLVEQNVRAAVEVGARAYVLDDGHVVYSGPAAEFAKDEVRVR